MKKLLNKNNVLNLAFLIPFALSACAKSQTSSTSMVNTIDPVPFSFAAAPEAVNLNVQNDPVRQRLGQVFLVEHFAVTTDSTMLQAIAEHQPGGILFWDQNKVNGDELREVIRKYSEAAKSAHHDPLLFSTDYEGGGLSFTPSGHNVPGIQRFTDGFTLLSHPIWLGKSLEKNGTELCTLHGQLMAKELQSAGINYPLSTVSDLAMKLMVDRGISTEPEQVSTCIRAIIDAFDAQGKMIFVTKHFPGLGQVVGDTHEGVSVSDAKTLAEMQVHLQPFQDAIKYVNDSNKSAMFSILASHAKLPLWDANNMTTESSIVLNEKLKKELGMKGIVLSDAMWMGDYGKMNGDELMAVYLNSFISGMDMLMIPGSRFAQSITFFRSVYDNTITPAAKTLVETRTGKSWDEVRSLFMSRLNETLDRIQISEHVVGHAVDSMAAIGSDEPKTFTVDISKHYREILQSLSSVFN